MSSYGSFVPEPPPQSKVIDFATLVAGVDPRWRDPPVVYIYRGRKFLEYPAADTTQILYGSEDGTTLYVTGGTGPVFYAPET